MKNNNQTTSPAWLKALANDDWMAVFAAFILIILTLIIHDSVPKLPLFFGAKEKWSEFGLLAGFVSGPNLLRLAYTYGIFALLAWAGLKIAGKPASRFLVSFVLIVGLSMVAQVISTHSSVKALNLETVFFSILIGLVIGNTAKLPDWFRQAIQSEFYIKIGLVLLGTTVLFNSIMKAGALGLVQALVVVISVWYAAFWIAKRLKVDSEMSIMLASAVSICGVSAAIATCGAIKGDSKKLSYIISLVLIVAIPMMILMPYLANWMGLSQEVAGAWIGGTIDTTGAVVATGTIVGETAQKYAVIIKSAQNVLLGLAAFLISIYWTWKRKGDTTEKPSVGLIWDRFPKFVIGFVAASLLFSFLLPAGTVKQVGESLKGYQSIWFSIAFVCIGLETRFRDIFNPDNRKVMYAFLLAQLINVGITLGIASLLF
jgi:uncharacterized integral membrane protein (TIGR00698 family)